MKCVFRKQFPQTPKTTPVIPSWQLAAKSEEKESESNAESAAAPAADPTETVAKVENTDVGKETPGLQEAPAQGYSDGNTSQDSDEFQNGVIVHHADQGHQGSAASDQGSPQKSTEENTDNVEESNQVDEQIQSES